MKHQKLEYRTAFGNDTMKNRNLIHRLFIVSGSDNKLNDLSNFWLYIIYDGTIYLLFSQPIEILTFYL